MATYGGIKTPRNCIICGKRTDDYHYRTITIFSDTGKTQQSTRVVDRAPICRQCDERINLLLYTFGERIGDIIPRMAMISNFREFESDVLFKHIIELMNWNLRLVAILVKRSKDITALLRRKSGQENLLNILPALRESADTMHPPGIEELKKLSIKFIEVAKGYNHDNPHQPF